MRDPIVPVDLTKFVWELFVDVQDHHPACGCTPCLCFSTFSMELKYEMDDIQEELSDPLVVQYYMDGVHGSAND